ncbi:fibronectin type III domain-containing protein [Ruminococcus sp.]|uniref:fibronectin type III domain-containing protein n=1 Tax=Ruminococcus sp. TaxID=41978 RepID=UPI002590AA09|nr:fibronectin type III domain-containing protein [Ruminococcus sp.]
MLAQFIVDKMMKVAMAAAIASNTSPSEMSKQHKVKDLNVSTVSVSCIKTEWDAKDGKDYKLTVAPTDEDTGYVENICIRFEGNSKSYITGLREGSEYEITVKELDEIGEPIDNTATKKLCSTESVEVIWNFEHEDGWTNCFAYEHAGGLTLDPSWSAIQGCIPDPITGTGIMRDEYGDYCCAMGTAYGYCGDRFLITLNNGVQFTTKICDSKGDRAYHPFGDGGKCVIEFIHADGCLPSCVQFTGNYGSYYWDGLIFDNIRSIQKINYGEKVEY